MSGPTYLDRQRDVLRNGLSAFVPAETRGRHAAYLVGSQNPDGGFSGREGPSDLYYTAFGLWSLHVLEALTPIVADRAREFLQANSVSAKNLIDLFSLIHGYRLTTVHLPADDPRVQPPDRAGAVELIQLSVESCRTADGGYGRTPGLSVGSTYATFLTALCYEEMGRPPPEVERTTAFLRSRLREDGGFAEVGPMKRGGTNPTAAAIGALRILQPEAGARAIEEGAVRFVASTLSPLGGLRANVRAPLGDLLSTFTGLWTLADLGGLEAFLAEDDRGRELTAFVRSVEANAGGFRAGLWDDRVDVEYTFYGLGCRALLANRASGGRQSPVDVA